MIRARQERPQPTISVTDGTPEYSMVCGGDRARPSCQRVGTGRRMGVLARPGNEPIYSTSSQTGRLLGLNSPHITLHLGVPGTGSNGEASRLVPSPSDIPRNPPSPLSQACQLVLLSSGGWIPVHPTSWCLLMRRLLCLRAVSLGASPSSPETTAFCWFYWFSSENAR